MEHSKFNVSRRTRLAAIRRAAESQGGVVSRAQLLHSGLAARTILGWRDDGVLTEVFRGAYSLDRVVSVAGERWAAHLSVGEHSILGGETALDALGLIAVPRRPVHLLVARRPPRKQSGVVVHETKQLHEDDIIELDGLPRCSSTARTLVNVASANDPNRLDRLLDRAVHLRQFDADAIDAALRRRTPTPGTRALEAAIARLDETSGRNRSELERLVIALIRDSDLPRAINNARIAGYEVDVWWPGTRAIIEADGGRFHSSPAQIAADRAKRAALEAFGFVVMRLDWADVNYNTDRTLERVERFRLANLAPPIPGPPEELDLSTRRFG